MAKAIGAKLLAFKLEVDKKFAGACASEIGSLTGWPSTRSDGTTPQAKRARPVEVSRLAVRSGGEAAAQEDNDEKVWIKGFGGEHGREAIAQHYKAIVEPRIDELVRSQVEFKCRAIATQYFLRFPSAAMARAFIMENAQGFDYTSPAGVLRKLRVQRDRPFATRVAGRILGRGWERARDFLRDKKVDYTRLGRRTRRTASWWRS